MRRAASPLIGAAAALVAAAVLFFPFQVSLTARVHRGGELRLAAPVRDGDTLVLEYVHSVNRRPVLDTLRVEGGALRIVSSRFDAFGAGIPDVAEPGHPLRMTADGWMEYTVDRLVPEVTLFVGRVADHRLHLGSRTVRLATLAEPGTALRFSVERLSLLRIWRTG